MVHWKLKFLLKCSGCGGPPFYLVTPPPPQRATPGGQIVKIICGSMHTSPPPQSKWFDLDDVSQRHYKRFHTSSNHATHPLSVLSPGRVQRLDEVGGVAEEERVAGGAADHGQHGQPHVREWLGREATVPDTQHVGHRFKQRPRVLFQPERLLKHYQIKSNQTFSFQLKKHKQ